MIYLAAACIVLAPVLMVLAAIDRWKKRGEKPVPANFDGDGQAYRFSLAMSAAMRFRV